MECMAIDVTLILQLLLNGIVVGGTFAMVALGLNLIVGVAKIMNFAQAEIIMLAMYASYTLYSLLGWIPIYSVVVIIPLFFLFGVGIYYIFLKKLVISDFNIQVIATLGLSLLLINLIIFTYGSNYVGILAQYSFAFISGFGVTIRTAQLYSLIYAVGATALLMLFLKKSTIGVAMRAASEDSYAASLMGINPNIIYALACGLAFALTAGAGSFISAYFQTFPTIGQGYIFLAFVAITIGGLGSFSGSIIGGFLIGIVGSFVSFFITPGLSDLSLFVLFIIVLIIAPYGLFGKRGRV